LFVEDELLQQLVSASYDYYFSWDLSWFVCCASPSLRCCYRYPFYALSLLNFEVSWLTWLRYSAWIPLFPLGFMCEGMMLLNNAHRYQQVCMLVFVCVYVQL